MGTESPLSKPNSTCAQRVKGAASITHHCRSRERAGKDRVVVHDLAKEAAGDGAGCTSAEVVFLVSLGVGACKLGGDTRAE